MVFGCFRPDNILMSNYYVKQYNETKNTEFLAKGFEKALASPRFLKSVNENIIFCSETLIDTGNSELAFDDDMPDNPSFTLKVVYFNYLLSLKDSENFNNAFKKYYPTLTSDERIDFVLTFPTLICDEDYKEEKQQHLYEKLYRLLKI